MYVNTIRKMTDVELVALLSSLPPTDEAVAHLAAAIADGWADGVRAEAVNECADIKPGHVARLEAAAELARRMTRKREVPSTKVAVRRGVHATSVWIDPERFRTFFWLRRIPLSAVGPMFGRCSSWANVAIAKRRIGFQAADELATALETHVDTFIREVGSAEELERAAAL